MRRKCSSKKRIRGKNEDISLVKGEIFTLSTCRPKCRILERKFSQGKDA